MIYFNFVAVLLMIKFYCHKKDNVWSKSIFRKHALIIPQRVEICSDPKPYSHPHFLEIFNMKTNLGRQECYISEINY